MQVSGDAESIYEYTSIQTKQSVNNEISAADIEKAVGCNDGSTLILLETTEAPSKPPTNPSLPHNKGQMQINSFEILSSDAAMINAQSN